MKLIIKFIFTFTIVICTALLPACTLSQEKPQTVKPTESSAQSEYHSENQTEPPTERPAKSEEEITLEHMSLEEKAAQTIVTGIVSTSVDSKFKSLAKRGVGGVILFDQNIKNSDQLIKLTNEIKAAAGDIPILIGMDEEGGRVTRLPSDVLSMPSAYSLAKSGDPKYVQSAWKNLSSQIKSFGLSTGFSPVLDIWSNPDNEAIGDRAFGRTANEVCSYGMAALQAMLSENVIAVAKHFPGHGDTDVDSHYGLPIVSKTEKDLDKMELRPFKAAIKNGVPAIMVAHILCTKLDPDNPATLSRRIVTDLLKKELGFDGVVFTDDLTMGAISESYTVAEASVKALNAGCDMILSCFGYDNTSDAIKAITTAVTGGKLSEDRLDDAVLRILKMKNKYKISNEPVKAPDVDKMNERTSEFWK